MDRLTRMDALEKLAQAQPPAPTKANLEARRTAVDNALARRIKDPAIRAGILANIDRETGGQFNPYLWEGNRKKTLDLNRKQTGGYGLFQYTGKNLAGYKRYLRDKGLQDTADSQIGFLMDRFGPQGYPALWRKYMGGESASPYSLSQRQFSYSPEEIADWFHRRVERPAHVIRGDAARIRRETQRHNRFIEGLPSGFWRER